MLMLVSCSKQGLFRSHVLGQGKCEYQEGVAIVTQRERPRARKGLVSVVILPPIDPSTGTDYSPINQSRRPSTRPRLPVNHGTDLYNARDESGQRVNPLLHISDLLLQAPVLAQLATFPAALIGSPGPFNLYDGSGGMRSNSTRRVI